VTVFAGIVGTLQVHAGNLNTNYRAETQRYSLDAMRIRSVGETMVSANLDYAARVDELLTQQNDLAELTGQTDAVTTLSEARAELAIISPAYGEPYASMGDKAAAAYEVDVYLRDATRAEQMRTFMQALDMAWDSKANTYIVHLTLLAVVLGLLGLCLVMSDIPRLMIFSTAILMTLITLNWSIQNYSEPLPAYSPAAVDAYVKGYTLAYQDDAAGAIAAYDEAIAALPSYGDAHYERALVHYGQGNNDEALAGFAAARAAGYDVSSVDSWQSYLYLVVGDIAQARTITQAWVTREPASPTALGTMIAVTAAESDPAAVGAATKALRDSASASVAAIRASGNEPDEDFFYAIDEAADIITELRDSEPIAGAPERSAEQAVAIDAAIVDVRSLATTLAFQLTPSAGTLQELVLGTNDGDAFAASDTFDNMSFDGIPLTIEATATAVPQGAHVLVKFFSEGYEDESLRYISEWDQASDGVATIDVPIDLGPSYVLPEGNYAVEVYIDGTLQGARMEFVVE
jgi:tetratricopeptide (TPR) repeat protein